MEEKLIRGLLVTPDFGVEEIEFEDDYHELKRLVEGYIEMPYIFPDVTIIINEEGKLNGSKPNKWLCVGKNIVDTIYGNIVIADSDEEGNLISLSDEKLEKYFKLFCYDRIQIA